MSKLIKKTKVEEETGVRFVNFTSNGKKIGFSDLLAKGETQAYRKKLADYADETFAEDPELEKIEFTVQAVIYRPKGNAEVSDDDMPW